MYTKRENINKFRTFSFFVSRTMTEVLEGGREKEAHEARGSRLESYMVTFLLYSCFLLAA